jgi:hypothetical protein
MPSSTRVVGAMPVSVLRRTSLCSTIRRYGAPRTDNGEIAPTPYVALVYGAGSIGVGRLQEAMRTHVITDMIDPLSMDSAEDSGGRFPRMDFADMTGLAEEAVPVTV